MLSRVGPGIIRWGGRSVLDGNILEGLASAPELSVWGKGACRTGMVASTPELSVGGEGACWTGLVASVGVTGVPSVYRSPKGDAPLSPELTVGADGDAVEWNAPRSVTYSRRRGIKVPPATTRYP